MTNDNDYPEDFDSPAELANDMLNQLARMDPDMLFELALAFGKAAMEEEDHVSARFGRMMSSAADALARCARTNEDARHDRETA